MSQPAFETTRLRLRSFAGGDAADTQRLAGHELVAATTMLIPHPYPDGAAEAWFATHEPEWRDSRSPTWAITLREAGDLIGAIGLRTSGDFRHAEMGYWIGVPYWGHGYCTEAARAVLRFAFQSLELHRVHAHHFGSNPASGRVLEKIGMKREGVLREHIIKNDRYEDAVMYAILRHEHDDPRAGT